MRLFVDTSGFKAFYDERDARHPDALDFIQKLRDHT
jgi:predicted nucleic acid-binding protein